MKFFFLQIKIYLKKKDLYNYSLLLYGNFWQTCNVMKIMFDAVQLIFNIAWKKNDYTCTYFQTFAVN